MYVEQMYTNCLAEAAYYVESNGEAVIIDPIRDIGQYIEKANSRGARITHVLETHFHADFVSGHIDLANATGATIVFGPGAETGYDSHVAKDGEIIPVGDVKIEVLHTPGHTPESTCYLLFSEDGVPYALFTGDTLFVGDVGRPDLLDGKLSKEILAGMMYDSLGKLKSLPDDLLVYPAHGPGSACGKNIGTETWSTLGKQRRSNYALQDRSREDFITELTRGLSAPPQYYFKDAVINKQGYAPLDDVMQRNVRPLALHDLDEALAEGAVILDTRKASDFETGFIPGSINVGLDGTYAWWVGTLFSIQTPLVIVAESGQEEESILRLARIGYERVLGYLQGGFETWRSSGRTVATLPSIEPQTFEQFSEGRQVIDVRNPGEYQKGHAERAENMPLATLESRLEQLSKDQDYVIHCAAGYRSAIAVSIMLRNGFDHVTNVHGGFGKMKQHLSKIVTEEEAVA